MLHQRHVSLREKERRHKELVSIGTKFLDIKGRFSSATKVAI